MKDNIIKLQKRDKKRTYKMERGDKHEENILKMKNFMIKA
jgi:hypothetical protein